MVSHRRGNSIVDTCVWTACKRCGIVTMAVNVLMPLLIPLGEQITNVTQLTAVGNLAFTQPLYEVFVKENTAPVLLLTLQAASNTSDTYVVYSLVTGAMGGLFTVDAYTGRLTLTAALDYEAKQSYDVIVGGQSGEERAFVRVMVRVRDVNDLPPRFFRPLFETQITEEDDRHLPKTILQVTAMDGDVSDRGRLLYTLTGDGVAAINSSFSISENSGDLHLHQPLDRDRPTGRARWELKVSATDGEHSDHAIVHVNVKDINDNAPFFPNSTINATVPENAEAESEVAQVMATDYDDPFESTNAVLTYSVEKNVIDEHSGQPIFTIDANTGRISTALCCLDRERTPFYAIQVVASDGGGRKGTGTVTVTVSDENDVSPRFSRKEWLLTVHETVTLNRTIAFLTIDDPDVTNEFAFRVLEDSGYGWERFLVVSSDHGSGSLQAVKNLDFEDPVQRQGFRFKVQVSDKEENRWADEAHMDSTWVMVTLVDDNDNVPELSTKMVNLSLSEDTPIGHSLATFTATDKDQDGEDEVRYIIDPSSDPFRLFVVDSFGRVQLRRCLDREASAYHTVRVLAIDSGFPALTATASLLLTVRDVNDNAPHVANPDTLVVPENSGPRHVADLRLDDSDDWSLGHGPPFTVKLDDNAPSHIKEAFVVDFDEKGDQGRGLAVVTSLKPLDREASMTRLLPLVLGDAQSLSATVTITLTIADVNDNPMRPASKTVNVTRFRGEEVPIPLGRVYVDDADDWDAGDKTWDWQRGKQHQLFILDPHTGHLTMSTGARDGTYDLQFWVSDSTHNQRNVPANVTVMVTSVSREVIACAVPVTLSTHSSRDLILPNQRTKTSPLKAFESSVEKIAGADLGVVFVEAQTTDARQTGGRKYTRVWVTARPRQPLDQLLLLHRRQISSESGVGVASVGVGVCVRHLAAKPPENGNVWVVDANRTALVTPRLETSEGGCSCHGHSANHYQVLLNAAAQPSVAAVTHPPSCHTDSCLNGGRCVGHARGLRCICPHGTSGSVCKKLSRYFRGNGWAWAAPIPASTHAHITLELRTTRKNCLLLYAGPVDEMSHLGSHSLKEDEMRLELIAGRPRFYLDLGTNPVQLTSTETHQLSSIADGRWHRLDLFWGHQKVEVIVDLCKHGGECRLTAPLPPQERPLSVAAPLQVGGLAHVLPRQRHQGWPAQLSQEGFYGCIRNLRVNGKLRDLGQGILGENSWPGCSSEDPCSEADVPCTHHSRCVEVKGSTKCDCRPGWSGEACSQQTQPVFFDKSSYVKFALSSIPSPDTISIQLRFRTWERRGQLVAITSQHGRDLAAIHLVAGHICLRLLLHPGSVKHLCLSQVLLADGEWHTVYIQRQGQWAEMEVDEGDGPLYNSTPTPSTLKGWSTPLLVDKREGVHVGGSPEYVGVSLYTVHHDFHDGCIDDLRVSGVQLPLPPLVNTSKWAQATMFTNVEASCSAPSSCVNVSCEEPLTCLDVWMRHECGCPIGSVQRRDGISCEDVNECVWSPCFNGGSCVNSDPGYYCVCPAFYAGEHCEAVAGNSPSLKLSVGALIALLVWTAIFLGVILTAYIIHLNRRRHMTDRGTEESNTALDISTQDSREHDHQEDVIELDVANKVKVQSQQPLNKETNIAGVDILRRNQAAVSTDGAGKTGCGCPHLPSHDDLRNYAYEGEGSSPGSLSSCCSGGDGGRDSRFLGGFQEVATLLNCLSGPQNPESHSCHKNHQVSSLSSISNHEMSSLKITNNQLTSSSGRSWMKNLPAYSVQECAETETHNAKNTPKKNILISVSKADTLESGIHNDNSNMDFRACAVSLPKRCNSLPRSRIPTIIVNNLHTEDQETGNCKTGIYHNSLKRKKALPMTSTCLIGTEDAALTSCCTHVTPMKGSHDVTYFLNNHSVCRACVTVSLHYDSKIELQGVPRRSLSASSVSYLMPKGNVTGIHPVTNSEKLHTHCSHRTCCLHEKYSNGDKLPANSCGAAKSVDCSCPHCQNAIFSTHCKKNHLHIDHKCD